MPKAAIAVVSTVVGSEGSAGLGTQFGAAAVTPAVVFTPAKHADGSAAKDPRP